MRPDFGGVAALASFTYLILAHVPLGALRFLFAGYLRIALMDYYRAFSTLLFSFLVPQNIRGALPAQNKHGERRIDR